MIHHNILESIGNTPLVTVNRLNPNKKVTVVGKLESRNPGGSVKERIALSMIEAAEKSGELRKDTYGAEILLTPAARATDGAIEKAYSMAREFPERYFLTDQFNNEANWQAHYDRTGPEIWQQTDGRITHLVATLGTSGTVMGLCAWFKERQPHVQIVAVEPHLGHRLQGLKNMKESYKPGIFDKKAPDIIVNIDDDHAFDTARKLARHEGMLVGMSSGAAMYAALEIAKDLDEGMVVAILPDGGERYLSTPLFTPEEAPAEGKKRKLRFFNTMTKKKEVFKPRKEGEVTFYSCGPTAYEPANLILRYLEIRGFKVASYMNFTDLDDNTIAGAEKAGMDLKPFTEKYINSFLSDIDTLGVKRATGYPKASEHVHDMIDISKELLRKGFAYEKHGSIYFDISNFSNYGKLSGIDLSKIQLGKTVDLDNYEKDNPRDFTLLKRSTLAELKKGIFFETEWGNVRPSWHIECSSMSTGYLGETLDALTGKQLARYWMHSEMLLVDGKKMSSDNNNVVTLKDMLAKGFTGREVRFLLLSVQYRKPINFSIKRLENVRTALRRLDEFTSKLLCLPPGRPHPEVTAYVSAMEEQFFTAMDDDLNVSLAMAAIYNFIKKTNPILQVNHLDRDQKDYILEKLNLLNQVLKIFKLQGCPLEPEIDALIQLREKARVEKDWQTADSARNELAERGIAVIDTANGPIWKRVVETEED
ncbi:MAG: pyridoxal-phosphate dependent enzyme [Desulfofustis sp.]